MKGYYRRKNKLKKLVTALLALCIAASLAISCFAAEATNEGGIDVRVNGSIIAFPDAQPFIDKNDRTLIPVRFVAEELGADVSWNNEEQIAIIEQNGIRIDVPIGSNSITVTENGAARNVQMDTMAILSEDRTYVPIRYVAESLGAWVSYSDLFNTVQIYRDVLTPEEITRLHGYHDLTYEDNAKRVGESTYGLSDAIKLAVYPELAHFVGTYGFENANEWKLRNPGTANYKGNTTGITFKYGIQPDEDYAKLILAEAYSAAKDMATKGKMTVNFKSDLSNVYRSRCNSSGWSTVRGILTVSIPNAADIAWISSTYGDIIPNPILGETRSIDVEVFLTANETFGAYWREMYVLE